MRKLSSDDSQSFLENVPQQHPPAGEGNPNDHNPSRTLWGSDWRRRIHRYWLYEASSSAISIVFFIGIIIVLSNHNGREYGAADDLSDSDMKRPLLYTYLSLMSAVMRAAMLLPVATAISQLKWSWFQSHRRLIDVERFDEASRGMIGSLELIWTVRARHLVAVGAAITVLALPVDAFIQNSVMMPVRRQPNHSQCYTAPERPTNETVLPRATIYNTSRNYDTSLYSYADTSMTNSIILGTVLMDATGLTIRGQNPGICKTGYCDFGTYQTLGIVSNCTDRSADIVRSNGTDQYYTLSDAEGLRLGVNEEEYLVVKSYKTDRTGAVKSDYGPLVVRTVILIDMWDDLVPLAMDCSLFWNVETMTASADDTTNLVIWDRPIEGQQNSTFEEGGTIHGLSLAYRLQSAHGCWANNRTITEKEDPALYQRECIYGVELEAHRGLQRYLLDDQEGFNGKSMQTGNNTMTNETTWSRTNTFVTTVENNAYYDRKGCYIRIEAMYYNIALYMARHVRVQGGMFDSNGHFWAGETVGTVYENVFYYKIEWVRLTMPAIIVFGSALFVLATAMRTKKDLQWRRSNIPMLFHGLHEQERETTRYEKDLVKMELVASKMKVKMVEGAQGVRLTGFRSDADQTAHDIRERA